MAERMVQRADSGGLCIASFGNPYRHDDGLGEVLVEMLKSKYPEIEVAALDDPLGLFGFWDNAKLVIVLDAMRSGARPGTVNVVDISELTLAAPVGTTTHGFGLVDAYRLATVLERAPERAVVVGIEGSNFENGVGLSPEVSAALPHALEHVHELVEDIYRCA